MVGTRLVMAIGCIAALAVELAGCATAPVNFPAAPPPDLEPVTVTTMDLRPTVSMDAQVISSPVFSVLSTSAGLVSDMVPTGSKVKAGGVVASVSGKPVVSPVAGVVVTSLIDPGQSVPAHLPLVAVRYSGFALSGTPSVWTENLLLQRQATARGQVTDASGPFDCDGIVPNGQIAPDGGYTVAWLCLMPKDVPAADGAPGVVVAVGEVAVGVVAVPLTSVAGRIGNGQVTLLNGGASRLVSVKLGRTDGTFIEILDGLAPGDTISPIAPDLAATGPA